MFTARNIHYEIAEKSQAIACGGIGVIHQMVIKSGLIKEIDKNFDLLKTHIPYHESDHVLNLAYNVLSGNVRLEDIELHRQYSGYLDALGAEQVLKMEFRRFLNTLIMLPCQIVRTGRMIVYRILGYNDLLKDFFETWERIRSGGCSGNGIRVF